MIRSSLAPRLLLIAGMATEESHKHQRVAADLFVNVRLEFGLTQEELAEKIGICGRHVQYVESGDKQPSAAIDLERQRGTPGGPAVGANGNWATRPSGLPRGYAYEILAGVVEYVLPSDGGGKWKKW